MRPYRILPGSQGARTKAEWLRFRQQGIGGSDAAAVLGLSPYQGPFAVYLSKVEDVGGDSDSDISEAAHWGNVLETHVAREFEERSGAKILRTRGILQSTKWPWMLATLDRWATIDGVRTFVECKTTSLRATTKWEDAIPVYYYCQVQHYMAVTGLDFAFICCLIGGQNYVQHRVERDEALIARMIEEEAALWDRVQRRDPPPVDGTADSEAYIKEMYPKALREAVDIGRVGVNLVLQLQAVKERAKELETEKKALENQLKALIKDAEVASADGVILATWSGYDKVTVDTKRMREEGGIDVSAYEVTSHIRTLRVRDIDETIWSQAGIDEELGNPRPSEIAIPVRGV